MYIHVYIHVYIIYTYTHKYIYMYMYLCVYLIPDQEMESSFPFLKSCLNLVIYLFLQNEVKWCPGVFKLGHQRFVVSPELLGVLAHILPLSTCKKLQDRAPWRGCSAIVAELPRDIRHELAKISVSSPIKPSGDTSTSHHSFVIPCETQVKITQLNLFGLQKCERW